MNIAALWVSILTLTVLIAACTTPEKSRWNRPGHGDGPKPTDLAACRADAKRRAEREFLLDTNPRGDREFATPSGLNSQLAQRDAKRYRQRIYNECLRNLGYRDAPARGNPAR
jgi:hypothetical protein